MSSKTTQVNRVRDRKKITNGRKRKNKLRTHGSTAPNLPLNKPNAQELAAKKK